VGSLIALHPARYHMIEYYMVISWVPLLFSTILEKSLDIFFPMKTGKRFTSSTRKSEELEEKVLLLF
jgi:hypothetical protein